MCNRAPIVARMNKAHCDLRASHDAEGWLAFGALWLWRWRGRCLDQWVGAGLELVAPLLGLLDQVPLWRMPLRPYQESLEIVNCFSAIVQLSLDHTPVKEDVAVTRRELRG